MVIPEHLVFSLIFGKHGGAWNGANHFMGFRSFAFHPDFARPGRPGYGKLYTVNTEKPVGVPCSMDPIPRTTTTLSPSGASILSIQCG